MQEKIVILDFGSQYTQLIARRVRELNVYCEIHPFNKIPELDASVRGVILSGSPFSVRDEKAPKPDLTAIKGRLPLLGVCYGAQYLAHFYGGEVQSAPSREYGRAMLTVVEPSDPLMQGVPSPTQVWMSHGDTITSVPDTYRVIASTEDVRYAAFRIEGERSWGIQFHPEVYHSTDGITLLRNFVVGICGCKQDWTPESFVETTVRELREKLGDDRVVLGLSGGVDSSVAAVLLHRAIGKNLYCIFVDSGLLRKNEFDSVLESYKGMGLNVKGVKAHDRFLGDLAGVTDPEKKRKIIGRDFRGGVQCRGQADRERKVAGAGYDLSRRGGVRFGIGQGTCRDDQVAPQRRRPARRDAPENRRAAAPAALRTRCAAWVSPSASIRSCWGGIRSPVRALRSVFWAILPRRRWKFCKMWIKSISMPCASGDFTTRYGRRERFCCP